MNDNVVITVVIQSVQLSVLRGARFPFWFYIFAFAAAANVVYALSIQIDKNVNCNN